VRGAFGARPKRVGGEYVPGCLEAQPCAAPGRAYAGPPHKPGVVTFRRGAE